MQRLTRKTIHKFKFKNDEPAAAGSNFISDRIGIINAFNWYNENGEIPKLRDAIEAYADKRYPGAVDTIKSLKDNQITMTMCAIARMYVGGCMLPNEIIGFLDDRIHSLLMCNISKDIPVTKESYNQVIADFDDMLDYFYDSDYTVAPPDFFAHLTVLSPRTKDVQSAITQYASLLDDIDQKRLSAKQIKSYTNFVTAIHRDCAAYLNNARKATALRKPRKKKLKSAEQLTAKARFKETDSELRLTSITPSAIVGAQSVWLFNTKTRKITYLEGQKLSVKGTTIIDFDDAKSFTKTIRKPEKLADMLNTTRIRMFKDIQALKTKQMPANGRLSADVLILRANK